MNPKRKHAHIKNKATLEAKGNRLSKELKPELDPNHPEHSCLMEVTERVAAKYPDVSKEDVVSWIQNGVSTDENAEADKLPPNLTFVLQSINPDTFFQAIEEICAENPDITREEIISWIENSLSGEDADRTKN